MFDCVMGTRNVRNGWLFTRLGDLKMKKGKEKVEKGGIEESWTW
ncbi:hypothetical protein [Neisseria sicca]|nr:hypothetical protein [Neisseria sicca]